MQQAVPFLIGGLLWLAAIVLGVYLGLRRRKAGLELLRGLGLEQHGEPGWNRTAWFAGSVDDRDYLAGQVVVSSPGMGHRRRRPHICVALPLERVTLARITQHKAGGERGVDGFDEWFRVDEHGAPPEAEVRRGLVAFAERHGAVNCWPRPRASHVLEPQQLASASHVLVWFAPLKRARDGFEAAIQELARLAATIESNHGFRPGG